MADFCLDCVQASWGDQDGRNDLRHEDVGGLWWVVCEGCGFHAFVPSGARLCERAQSDFDEPGEWIAASLRGEPCAECYKRAGGEP